MNRAIVDRIVSAVLYEGYVLYPYRPSLKNRQRWTFGGLYPRAYSESQGGSDAWSLQAECLVEGGAGAALDVTVRFLQLVQRRIGKMGAGSQHDPASSGSEACREAPVPGSPESPIEFVESLRVGDTLYQAWQEAVEREIAMEGVELESLSSQPQRHPFHFPSQRTEESLRSADGKPVGIIARDQETIDGVIDVSSEPVEPGLWKITVCVRNASDFDGADRATRDEALMRSLVSTHVILGARAGAFVSLVDPPLHWRGAAGACRNMGVWPVLVGDEGARDTMLASPIILYDYPQVALESPGPFFDSTEIDELLSLRILTLTDDEKQAMSAVDPQTAALLERTEARARQELMGLHGAMRDIKT